MRRGLTDCGNANRLADCHSRGRVKNVLTRESERRDREGAAGVKTQIGRKRRRRHGHSLAAWGGRRERCGCILQQELAISAPLDDQEHTASQRKGRFGCASETDHQRLDCFSFGEGAFSPKSQWRLRRQPFDTGWCVMEIKAADIIHIGPVPSGLENSYSASRVDRRKERRRSRRRKRERHDGLRVRSLNNRALVGSVRMEENYRVLSLGHAWKTPSASGGDKATSGTADGSQLRRNVTPLRRKRDFKNRATHPKDQVQPHTGTQMDVGSYLERT